MNCNTSTIKSVREISAVSGQQNIEADIILPDYYDTIGKIILCDLSPSIEAVNMAGEKVSISGCAKLNLIYMSEEKKIFSYENEYKYTKVFQIRNNENCICSDISQNVFSLNCRAVGPKRIEFRSVLQIAGKIRMLEETEVLTETDSSDIITKYESIEFSEPVLITMKDFTVNKEDINLNNNSPVHIIRKNSRMYILETKPIHNKLYMKGYFETDIYYFSENSTEIRRETVNIPFSEILDLFGIEEDDMCKISSENISCDIIISQNTDEKKSEIRIAAFFDITVYRKISKKLVSDAYSLKSVLMPEFIYSDAVTGEYKLTNKENVSFEADIFDDGQLTILDAFADNIRISSDRKGERLTALITADFNALIKDCNDAVYIISREYTFESIFSLPDLNHKAGKIHIEMLSISALQNKTDKISFRCEINVSTEISECRKVKAITDFNLTPCAPDETKERFILYFACKDEELWTIAKDNMTCVEDIKNINNISSDKIPENMTILLPSF